MSLHGPPQEGGVGGTPPPKGGVAPRYRTGAVTTWRQVLFLPGSERRACRKIAHAAYRLLPDWRTDCLAPPSFASAPTSRSRGAEKSTRSPVPAPQCRVSRPGICLDETGFPNLKRLCEGRQTHSYSRAGHTAALRLRSGALRRVVQSAAHWSFTFESYDHLTCEGVLRRFTGVKV